MNIKDFRRRLYEVKSDYETIENKCKEFIRGLSSILDDADGIATSWLYDAVKNEMKNLIYAVDPNKLLGKGNDWKTIDDKVDDLIDYYMFESDFGGNISWVDEDGGHNYDLSDDEQLLEYIEKGLIT